MSNKTALTQRPVEQVQGEDYPAPFNLREKEKEIEKHFTNIRRIRESAAKAEVPEDRGIMLKLADIFEHRHRFLEEKYWSVNGKEKDSRFAGYIRDRFGRADDQTFYTESYTLARVAKFLTARPEFKPMLSDEAILNFKQKNKNRKYAIANLAQKIRALSWKSDEIQDQYFDEDGNLDAEKLNEVTLDEIREEGRETKTIPWQKFKALKGVQHKVEGKDIIVKIKNIDLRSIYDQQIINELDSPEIIRATSRFIAEYKKKKK